MGKVGIKFHPKYSSYLPLLMKSLDNVEGDVLEMGSGPFSTQFLHWYCFEHGRRLVTYENNEKFYNIARGCESDFHEIILVDDWDKAEIEKPWGVALIDHAPGIRRKDDVRRLANWALVIIIHDCQGRSNKNYHYDEIYPLFKYTYYYSKVRPHSKALSNFLDVSKWQ
jgi:hypothetical protein